MIRVVAVLVCLSAFVLGQRNGLLDGVANLSDAVSNWLLNLSNPIAPTLRRSGLLVPPHRGESAGPINLHSEALPESRGTTSPLLGR